MIWWILIVLAIISVLWALWSLKSMMNMDHHRKVKQSLSRGRVVFHKDSSNS